MTVEASDAAEVERQRRELVERLVAPAQLLVAHREKSRAKLVECFAINWTKQSGLRAGAGLRRGRGLARPARRRRKDHSRRHKRTKSDSQSNCPNCIRVGSR